jgi:hypothetical protein
MDQAFSVYRKIGDSPQVAVHGQVLTKPHIVELMLDLAGYVGDRNSKLLDPGCGEGAFAAAAATRLVRSSGVPRSMDDVADYIFGIDHDSVAACRQRVAAALVFPRPTSAPRETTPAKENNPPYRPDSQPRTLLMSPKMTNSMKSSGPHLTVHSRGSGRRTCQHS